MSQAHFPLPFGRKVNFAQDATFSTRSEITNIFADDDITKTAITVGTDERLKIGSISAKTDALGSIHVHFDQATLSSARAIVEKDSTANTITVAGDHRTEMTPSRTFTVANSTGDDGSKTVVSSTYDAATDITTIVVTAVANDTDDGDITSDLVATNGSTIIHGEEYPAGGGESMQWDNPQNMLEGGLGQSLAVIMDGGAGNVHGVGFIRKIIARTFNTPQAGSHT